MERESIQLEVKCKDHLEVLEKKGYINKMNKSKKVVKAILVLLNYISHVARTYRSKYILDVTK